MSPFQLHRYLSHCLAPRETGSHLPDKPCCSQQAPVLEAVTGARSSFQSGSRQSLASECWVLAGGLGSSPLGPPQKAAWEFTTWQPAAPRANDPGLRFWCKEFLLEWFSWHVSPSWKEEGFWQVNLVEGTKYGQSASLRWFYFGGSKSPGCRHSNLLLARPEKGPDLGESLPWSAMPVTGG